MIELEKFLPLTQSQLFNALCRKYQGQCVISKRNFILVRGEAPIMLLAHLDTVHKDPVREICTTADKNILMSPQGIGGDDRCGVYALANVREKSSLKPWLLFTCDEEIGGVGAEKFCLTYESGRLPAELSNLKLLVEIDRRGKNDAVYYDCANEKFEAYITSKGFKTASGSFSDISLVAPTLGVAAVNLSSGYHNAHTLHEYINRQEINATIEKVVEIVADASRANFPCYEYVAAEEFHIPANVPTNYRKIYRELLYSYSLDELEYHRKIFGDKILDEIYHEEYGGFFEGGDWNDSDE